MQQDRQFACDGNDSTLLSTFATHAGPLQAPSSQVSVSTAVAQHVLSAVDQELAEVRVACLGDAELR
jgi:hypothetical protein